MNRKLATGILSLLIFTVGTPMAYAADNGSGSPGCQTGEICFGRDYSSGNPGPYRHDFYFSADHTGYVYYDATNNQPTNLPLQNTASSVSNRDSQCDVKVVNDRGIYPDDIFTAANHPTTNTYVFLQSLNDSNDRHERYNCG